MRFSTAVAILLLQTQQDPVASDTVLLGRSQEDGKFSQSLVNSKVKNIVSKLNRRDVLAPATFSYSECNPRSIDPDVGVLSCDDSEDEDVVCIPHEKSSLGGFCVPRLSSAGVDKLENGKQDTLQQQCDPSSTNADIGILSCAENEFCMMDTSSSATLGGICVQIPAILVETVETKNVARRQLLGESINSTARGYVHCDATSPYYGVLDCNCDDFNLEANAGSFECSYSSYCFGGFSECCAETCANITLSYTSSTANNGTEGGEYSWEVCYNFESPHEQSFCYGYSGIQGDGASSCFGSFNGMNCDSCNVDGVSMNYTTGTGMFNCGNTGVGINEEFGVDDFYPPILTTCYADCYTCSLCPDNQARSVANPALSVGFAGLTCGDLDYLGSIGYWGSAQNETCTDLIDAVNADCCTPKPEEFLPEEQVPVPAPTTDLTSNPVPTTFRIDFTLNPAPTTSLPVDVISSSPDPAPVHLISVPTPTTAVPVASSLPITTRAPPAPDSDRTIAIPSSQGAITTIEDNSEENTGTIDDQQK